MIDLPRELKELLHSAASVKVLGTVASDGSPHVVLRDSIRLLDDGNIAFAEELDSSITSKNMVRAIWFDKIVTITLGEGEKQYQIKGRPFKCLITGPLFKEFLLSEREKTDGDADIQAVWLITPIEVIHESRKARKEGEMKKDPFYNVHLDRLKVVSSTDNKR
jgi:predicted pyridoxine 5'-phosphate oxidase superfamily flavin-nucleotide-binding protein